MKEWLLQKNDYQSQDKKAQEEFMKKKQEENNKNEKKKMDKRGMKLDNTKPDEKKNSRKCC